LQVLRRFPLSLFGSYKWVVEFLVHDLLNRLFQLTLYVFAFFARAFLRAHYSAPSLDDQLAHFIRRSLACGSISGDETVGWA
jgi:hypothetical protein